MEINRNIVWLMLAVAISAAALTLMAVKIFLSAQGQSYAAQQIVVPSAASEQERLQKLEEKIAKVNALLADQKKQQPVITSDAEQLQEMQTQIENISTHLEQVNRKEQDRAAFQQEFKALVSDPGLQQHYRDVAVQQRQERHAAVAQSFAQESIDSEWAETTVEEIEAQLGASDLAGVSLADAQCRSTMCRVDVDVAKLEGVDATMMEFEVLYRLKQDLVQGSVQKQALPDGSYQYSFLLNREGFNTARVHAATFKDVHSQISAQ